MMSRLSWLQRVYWSKFAKPIEQRALFRFLVQTPISSILEIGVGDGVRMQRIAKLVSLRSGTDQLRYIGIDEFESSKNRAHLTLKQAHRMATQLGFKASLIPGSAEMAIPRAAHKFSPSDLIIIDGGLQLSQPMAGPIGGWLNRLAHRESTIIAAEQEGGLFTAIETSSLDLPLSKAA
jgi:hypothetical protein